MKQIVCLAFVIIALSSCISNIREKVDIYDLEFKQLAGKASPWLVNGENYRIKCDSSLLIGNKHPILIKNNEYKIYGHTIRYNSFKVHQ